MENRWEHFSQYWNERTERMLMMLPKFSSLLEFGEGNGNTRSLLPGVKYTGSDMYKRNEHTIVCNLNTIPLPYFEYHDVILMSGVLEYLYDINSVISNLSNYTDIFCVSYAGKDNHNIEDEMVNGWTTCISYKDLIDIFKDLGFTLIDTGKWKRQQLFVFKRNLK